MALQHLGFRDAFSYSPQIRNAVYRVKLLHGLGRDVVAAERVEPLAGQLGVVAQVGKSFCPLCKGPALPTRSPTSRSMASPARQSPNTRQSRSCSFRAANIKADGIVDALNRRFISSGSRPCRAAGLVPVPTDTISIRSAPVRQRASGF